MKKITQQSGSAMIDSLGDGTWAKSGSSMVIRFERRQTDDDIRYVLQQCDRELVSAHDRFGVTESPFYYAFPEWDKDKRELYEIPKARAFAERLASMGLMAVLNYKTAFDNPDLPLGGQVWFYCLLNGIRRFLSEEEEEKFLATVKQSYIALNKFIGVATDCDGVVIYH